MLPSEPARSEDAKAPTEEVMTDDDGRLDSLGGAVPPSEVSLRCSTFDWLPDAKLAEGRDEGSSGSFVIRGGRVDVSVESLIPLDGDADIHVRISSDTIARRDPRMLSTRAGGVVSFFLVEGGQYAAWAMSADGRLYGKRTFQWSPGVAERVDLHLREPGCGFVDVSVVDERGIHVSAFALEIEGPDRFSRLVHSEDLFFGSLLGGLPEGRVTLQLVSRIKSPLSLYRVGARKSVRLAAGEVEQVAFRTSQLARVEIRVQGEVEGEWELKKRDPDSSEWSKIGVCRFTDEGGMQFSSYVSEDGVYLTPPLDASVRSLRFSNRLTQESIGIEVALSGGVILQCDVRIP